MITHFFIRRPIFATVISLVIVIAGLVAQRSLPIAKFPEIAPPTVQVTAFYPGANAQVVAETVAAPIEQEVNGVENMLYMSSNSADDGSYTLTVTFEIGTDMDMAQVLVQNRVSIATPKAARGSAAARGHHQEAVDADRPVHHALVGRQDVDDTLFLSNYATLNIQDELSRIKGVGDVTIFGVGDYSMRVWLDPRQLKAAQPDDRGRRRGDPRAERAGRRRPDRRAARRPTDTAFQYTINTLGRLRDAEQFENLIIKTAEPAARITRVKDVARVELGAKDLQVRRHVQRHARAPPSPSTSCPAPTPWTWPTRSRAKMEELSAVISRGAAIRHPVRHDAVRHGLDRRRSTRRSGHRRAAGRPGDLHLPAGLAGDARPLRRDPRVADRHVRRHGRRSASRSTC